MIALRLYIAGQTLKSKQSIDTLHAFFDNGWKSKYSLEVIDLLNSPEAAEQDNVFATPTLVKTHPAPSRKIIGDFVDKQKVFKALEFGECH
jgi:circadian clock protein KaiB